MAIKHADVKATGDKGFATEWNKNHTIEDDTIKDNHVDFGTGAGQVNADDIPDGTTNKLLTTGTQTIAGEKTFSTFPLTPSSAPITDYQVANKKYVNDSTGAGVYFGSSDTTGYSTNAEIETEIKSFIFTTGTTGMIMLADAWYQSTQAGASRFGYIKIYTGAIGAETLKLTIDLKHLESGLLETAKYGRAIILPDISQAGSTLSVLIKAYVDDSNSSVGVGNIVFLKY